MYDSQQMTIACIAINREMAQKVRKREKESETEGGTKEHQNYEHLVVGTDEQYLT